MSVKQRGNKSSLDHKLWSGELETPLSSGGQTGMTLREFVMKSRAVRAVEEEQEVRD